MKNENNNRLHFFILGLRGTRLFLQNKSDKNRKEQLTLTKKKYKRRNKTKHFGVNN